MKIQIPQDIQMYLKQNHEMKFILKILNTGSNFTLVEYKGKAFRIPVILDKNKTYSAKFDNNNLNISETLPQKKPLEQIINGESKVKDIHKLLDNIFFRDEKNNFFFENTLNNFNLFELFSRITDKDKDKKNEYFFTDKSNQNYYFLFNLLFFNMLSYVFININRNKNVIINILVDNEDQTKEDELLNGLKNDLNGKIVNMILKLTFDKKDFYQNIINCFQKNIDIKI